MVALDERPRWKRCGCYDRGERGGGVDDRRRNVGEKAPLVVTGALSGGRVTQAHGAEKAILIGSLAEGRIGPFSDIDLMVVPRTDKRFLDRLKDVQGRIRPRVSMDILIYIPEEPEEMERINPFIRHAMGKGKALYAVTP